MNKKLPNLYVNKIEKKINNNKAVFYSGDKHTVNSVAKKKSSFPSEVNVTNKIRDMFNSPNFVYKINATVIMKDGTEVNKDIIGQVNRKLITIDDDFININDITDIKF